MSIWAFNGIAVIAAISLGVFSSARSEMLLEVILARPPRTEDIIVRSEKQERGDIRIASLDR